MRTAIFKLFFAIGSHHGFSANKFHTKASNQLITDREYLCFVVGDEYRLGPKPDILTVQGRRPSEYYTQLLLTP